METFDLHLDAAHELARTLERKRLRLVLVESCTAGNVAAALGSVPGISNWLCGSFVVYRNESKTQWLGVPRPLLDDPRIGPVSPQVTKMLAQQALAKTPEANVSVAVTGHIGPNCPRELDGKVYMALVRRAAQNESDATVEVSNALQSPAPVDTQDRARRQQRLIEATHWVLREIQQAIEQPTDGASDNRVRVGLE